jgi:hypothetical protein
MIHKRSSYAITDSEPGVTELTYKERFPPSDADLKGLINSHGLSLELDVAMLLSDFSEDCKHSVYYTDAITGKAREMDFVLQRGKKIKSLDVVLVIPIECKDCRNDAIIGAKSPLAVVPDPSENVDLYLFPDKVRDSKFKLWAGFGNAVTGIATYRESSRNNDDVQFAFTSLQAMSHLVLQYDNEINATQSPKIVIYCPILVTKAKIAVTSKAPGASELSMSIENKCTVIWNYSMTNHLFGFVTVCNLDELMPIVRRLVEEFDALGDDGKMTAIR